MERCFQPGLQSGAGEPYGRALHWLYWCGLCRGRLGQGGDLVVVVAWISEGWGRCLGEVPLLVPHPGGWGWGERERMGRCACYLHTWALVYVFV